MNALVAHAMLKRMVERLDPDYEGPRDTQALAQRLEGLVFEGREEGIILRDALRALLASVCADPRWCSTAAHKAARAALQIPARPVLYRISWTERGRLLEHRNCTLASLRTDIEALLKCEEPVELGVLEEERS